MSVTNADLEVLRAKAEAGGTVFVDATVLLELLSHVDELRTDLHNIDAFIDRSELKEESCSPTVWAWNHIVAEFRGVPRLSGKDLDVVPAPVIERLDTAERRIEAARSLAQRAINHYNRHSMIKARTVIELLDGTPTEQLTA